MQKTAKMFKALADTTRLRILLLLLEGELCVCEIMVALALPQSTVSRHLAYLRNSGWVKDRRQGAWMYYCLNNYESVLPGELIPLLEKHLAEDAERRVDLERLRLFRAEQQRTAC